MLYWELGTLVVVVVVYRRMSIRRPSVWRAIGSVDGTVDGLDFPEQGMYALY